MAATLRMTAAPGMMVYGAGDSARVFVLGDSGAPRSVRAGVALRKPSEVQRDAAIEQVVMSMPGTKADMEITRTYARRIPAAPVLPSYSALMFDEVTRLLWVQQSVAGDGETVLERRTLTGVLQSTVRIPAELDVFSVRNNVLVARSTNAESGEQSLVLYRMTDAGSCALDVCGFAKAGGVQGAVLPSEFVVGGAARDCVRVDGGADRVDRGLLQEERRDGTADKGELIAQWTEGDGDASERFKRQGVRPNVARRGHATAALWGVGERRSRRKRSARARSLARLTRSASTAVRIAYSAGSRSTSSAARGSSGAMVAPLTPAAMLPWGAAQTSGSLRTKCALRAGPEWAVGAPKRCAPIGAGKA